MHVSCMSFSPRGNPEPYAVSFDSYRMLVRTGRYGVLCLQRDHGWRRQPQLRSVLLRIRREEGLGRCGWSSLQHCHLVAVTILNRLLLTIPISVSLTLVGGSSASATQASDSALVSSGGEVVRGRSIDTSIKGGGFTGALGQTKDAEPASVIGSDERTRVSPTTAYPNRAVGYLSFSSPSAGFCSATLVSRDTVITAGHCVHGGGAGGRFFGGLRYYPARDGSLTPYGSCVPRVNGIYVLGGWLERADEAFDLAAIKLDCTVGVSTGWLGIFWQSASQASVRSILQGYPSDKPTATMWRSSGTVATSQRRQNFYSLDTYAGESGSPVYQQRGQRAALCRGFCVHTVHTNGLHGTETPHANANHGRRLDQGVYNAIVAVAAAA